MSNIILTGAGSGIGFYTALNLLKKSANTVLGVSRTADNLEALRKEAAALPGKLHILSYDVTDYSYEALDAKLSEIGMDKLDVLINNAAGLVQKSFEDHDAEDYRDLMEVNYIAPAMLIRHMLPMLKRSGNAHVVNISSVAGFQGTSKYPGITAYAGSKAAIISLTECLAQEFIEDGIRVNAVAFGSVQTRMLEKNFPGVKAPVTAQQAGRFLSRLALEGHEVHNGKIIPATVMTPF